MIKGTHDSIYRKSMLWKRPTKSAPSGIVCAFF